MVIEIDQSGRVEYTSHKTIIGDSLGNIVGLSTKDKRTLQKLYREADKPRVFVTELFSALVALLIKKSWNPTRMYMIDTEYPGKSETIKSSIIKISHKLGISLEAHQLSFGGVGKTSKAHESAHRRFAGKTRDKLVELGAVLRLLLP